jgi:hypothetical protein
MKINLPLISGGLFAALVFAACGSSSSPAVPTVVYSTSPPILTPVRISPTSIPQGQVVSYNDLQVVMSQAEITTAYVTEYDSEREPTSGGKFLWIEVQFENTGSKEQIMPTPEHFSVVYGTSEFKPAYGHRKNYIDYDALKPGLLPGQKVAAWLRFDIPGIAELGELRFVFLPESVQVSLSSASTGYTWADHPEFYWQCAQ